MRRRPGNGRQIDTVVTPRLRQVQYKQCALSMDNIQKDDKNLYFLLAFCIV